MFSGIVQELGTMAPTGSGYQGGLTVTCATLWSRLAVGDSIAVNGCCLTVVDVRPGSLVAEVIPETLRRTNLGALSAGDQVNLEVPLTLGSLVGGHLLSGHVDALGEIRAVTPEENSVWLEVSTPAAVARYCVAQGSIGIDGCSLTLAAVQDLADGSSLVRVSLIPHTVAVTIAGRYRVGSRVNLEADLLGKLVERLAPLGLPDRSAGQFKESR